MPFCPGRGYEQSRVILGIGYYDAFLVHDGCVPYGSPSSKLPESSADLLPGGGGDPFSGRNSFPRGDSDLLQASLALRDRYQQGEVSEHGLPGATGRLEAKLDRWLERRCRNPANRRLRRHLQHQRPWLCTFLYCPGLEATNHRAEQALRDGHRPQGVGRQSNLGGARTQQVLVSVLRTCWQQGKDPFVRLVRLLRSPQAVTLDLAPGPP